jgi:DUF4097 and DUF4098 domain-containing protein YvlB
MLLVVGTAMIIDKAAGSSYTTLVMTGWPLVLISLGVEYLLFHFWYKSADKRLKLDVGGILFAFILSSVVIGTTQAMFFDKWFHGSGLFSFSEESGYRFDKETVNIPLDAQTGKLIVNNPAGDVSVKADQVDHIQVEAVVWVDTVSREEAEQIAGQSRVEYNQSDDSTLKITAQGKQYGSGLFSKRNPRMNLVVTIPSTQKLDLELQLINGKAAAAGLPVKEQITATTVNGEISISDISANVKLSSTNGKIAAANIKGDTEMSTTNGILTLKGNVGDARLNSTNGEIRADDIAGSLRATTTNGNIFVNGILQGLSAHTTNGAVHVDSGNVGGDWDIKTTHGKISITLPSTADVKVMGEGGYGHITSDFPLKIDKRSITGILGAGTHRLSVETNGSIAIRKAD